MARRLSRQSFPKLVCSLSMRTVWRGNRAFGKDHKPALHHCEQGKRIGNRLQSIRCNYQNANAVRLGREQAG